MPEQKKKKEKEKQRTNYCTVYVLKGEKNRTLSSFFFVMVDKVKHVHFVVRARGTKCINAAAVKQQAGTLPLHLLHKKKKKHVQYTSTRPSAKCSVLQ